MTEPTPTNPREWDAAGYDALPLPHVNWGRRTLARLPLRGDETVLELGCGTGRDTEALLAALPRGRVIALDGSAQMVSRTQERCGDAGDRLQTMQADLRHPLAFPADSVDAVFSVATLHWVPDHAAVFDELARVLRPGGRMALDYGGPGNVAEVGEALVALGRDYAEVDFPAAAEERKALEAAGFTESEVVVRHEPPFVPGEHLHRYLETICLGRQLTELTGADRAALVDAVAQRIPGGALNYVRTEVWARY